MSHTERFGGFFEMSESRNCLNKLSKNFDKKPSEEGGGGGPISHKLTDKIGRDKYIRHFHKT